MSIALWPVMGALAYVVLLATVWGVLLSEVG
jgi:hypothetical protein